MAALPFFLIIWFSPMALFSTRLRSHKRRLTTRDLLIAVAVSAGICALILRGRWPLGAIGLMALYVAPILFAVLYLPRGWDVTTAAAWSIGTLIVFTVIVGSAEL